MVLHEHLMKLAIIAAIANNRVIGREGKLPWHISEDLKRFKRLTTGHAVLMGRKTYESLGKPLANRRNVVVTSTPIAGAECYNSITSALAALHNQETVFVIGGAQLYSHLFKKADFLYLTFVDRDVEGDVFFPDVLHSIEHEFTLVHREEHEGFAFADYLRKSSA